jgi:hypothetical protein
MILHLRKYVKTHSFEEIKQTLYGLNTNSSYGQFLIDVLGTDLGIPFQEQQSLLEDNVAAAKEILSLIEEVKKPPVDIDKFLASPFIVKLNKLFCGEVCSKERKYPQEYVDTVKAFRSKHIALVEAGYSSSLILQDPELRKLQYKIAEYEKDIDPEDLQQARGQRAKEPEHFNLVELT